MTTTPSALHPLKLEDPSAYLIDDTLQIAHLLQRLGQRPELICLYPGEQQAHFSLSALLAVQDGLLYFDVSPDPRVNQMLAASAYLTCVSGLDRVHIQFTSAKPRLGKLDNQAALIATLPTDLLFVQRRDYFRLTVPAQQPIYCSLPASAGHYLDIPILDISLGGVSLLGPIPNLAPRPGLQLPGCQIALPESGILEADLLVSTTHEHSSRSQRIGCRFMHLNATQQKHLQRYITRLERLRLSQT